MVMTRTHRHIASPIIGRVTALNKMVLQYTKQTPRNVKYPYVEKMKTAGVSLYILAIKMLDSKNVGTKAMDALRELNSLAYLIHALEGLTDRQLITFDCECAEVERQLNSIMYGQNVKTNG